MSKNKFRKINEILDMPREINNIDTKITILSFEEVLIENYKGIIEYEEFFIKINIEIGAVNIHGFNLNLEQLTEEDILIKGVINSIDLERIT